MVLYVDGGCSGNEQHDLTKRRMVAVVTDDKGVVVHEREQAGGSNNIAELIAVRDALMWARDHREGPQPVEIRTDSKNNLSWVFNPKLGKRLNDRPTVEALRQEIAALSLRRCAEQWVPFTLVWVPRAENLAGHYIERRYGC
jgi:ribonuclease HI